VLLHHAWHCLSTAAGHVVLAATAAAAAGFHEIFLAAAMNTKLLEAGSECQLEEP
jgi:hypothetical protein